MSNRVQYRRDTKARWAEVNPVLMEGEVGLEIDTKNIKMGDGVHAWNELEYCVGIENITSELGDSENLAVSQKLFNHKLIDLEKKIGDRFVVEGNITNLPDDEDLTSVRVSERDVLKLADRSYAPYNFSGKGYKILRKNITPVSLAVTKIAVSSVPTSDGYISFIINGIESHVDVVVSVDTTTDKVADKIVTKLTETMTEYEVSKDASTITLTRKFGGEVSVSSFSAVNTGTSCSIADSTKQEFRNLLTSTMINQPNTIYEIRYDFDLNGESIEVPDRCILIFEGGSFNNGTLYLNECVIKSGGACFKNQLNIEGNILNYEKNIIWFDVFNESNNNAQKINKALALGGKIVFPQGTYDVNGIMNIKKQVVVEFNGSVLKNVEQINFEASNCTLDLQGGEIVGTLHFAKLAEATKANTNYVVIEEKHNLVVGQILSSSYGNNGVYPLGGEGNGPRITRIEGNKVYIDKVFTDDINVAKGIFVGDFSWSALISPNFTQNNIIKNGIIKNTPGYFFTSKLVNDIDKQQRTSFNFENVNFSNNGLDAFYLCHTDFYLNKCNIGQTLDVAKQGIVFAPSTNLLIENTKFERGNYDIDICSYPNIGWNILFDINKRGTIIIRNSTFNGENKLKDSEFFSSNALHCITLDGGNNNSNKAYYEKVSIEGCKFTHYTRSAIALSTYEGLRQPVEIDIIDIRNTVFEDACIEYLKRNYEYIIHNFFITSSLVRNNPQKEICGLAKEYANDIKFNSCRFELKEGSEIANATLNDCTLINSKTINLTNVKFNDLLLENSTLSIIGYYHAVNRGNIIIADENADLHDVINVAVDSYSRTGSSGIVIQYIGSTTKYHVLNIAGQRTVFAAEISIDNINNITSLYGNDWIVADFIMGISSKFNNKGFYSDFSANKRALLKSIDKNSKSMTIDVSGFYQGYSPAKGMYVLIPLSTKKVFVSRIVSYESGVITLSESLPEEIPSDTKFSIINIKTNRKFTNASFSGSQENVPILPDEDKGFLYYNTTNNKLMFYNGSWINIDGHHVDFKTKGSSEERPTPNILEEGDTFFDTSLKKMILWNGTAWVNMDGTTLS